MEKLFHLLLAVLFLTKNFFLYLYLLNNHFLDVAQMLLLHTSVVLFIFLHLSNFEV